MRLLYAYSSVILLTVMYLEYIRFLFTTRLSMLRHFYQHDDTSVILLYRLSRTLIFMIHLCIWAQRIVNLIVPSSPIHGISSIQYYATSSAHRLGLLSSMQIFNQHRLARSVFSLALIRSSISFTHTTHSSLFCSPHNSHLDGSSYLKYHILQPPMYSQTLQMNGRAL
jgi:hypothetical protein